MGIIFTGYRRKTCKSFSDCAELQHFCFCVSCNVMSNRQSTVSSSTFGMHTTFGNNFSIKYRYRQQVRQLHSSVSYNRSYNCLPLSYFEPIISEYESNPQFFYACLAKFFRRVKSLAFREIAWDTRKVDEMQGHQKLRKNVAILPIILLMMTPKTARSYSSTFWICKLLKTASFFLDLHLVTSSARHDYSSVVLSDCHFHKFFYVCRRFFSVK